MAHLGYLLNALSNQWGLSTLASGNWNNLQPYVSSEVCSSHSIWVIRCSPSWSFTLYTCIVIVSKDSLTLCIFSELFFHVALSSPELCPATFSCLKLPDLQCLSFQLRENICALLRIPHPFCNLECASRQKARAVLGLPCFSCIRDCSPTLLGINCLKTVVSYIYASFLIVWGRRVNPVPVTPWLEAEISPRLIPSHSQTCLVALLLHGLKSFLYSWGVGKLFLVFR